MNTRPVKTRRLTTYFTVLITIVIIIVLGVYLAWSIHAQRAAAENKALAEAQTLNRELDAIWDYINDQQGRINYNSDGTYDFKGIYCTIAAKNIAQRFMQHTDYVIRYVREDPRTATDEPDAFEIQAIDAYHSQGAEEFWAVTTFNDQPALRYTSVLYAELNCLKCHGKPTGELDEVGFVKEGMEFGDLAGLTSIVIPLSTYHDEVSALVARDFVLAIILVTVICIVIWIGLRSWVTRPLAHLNQVAQAIGQAEFSAAPIGIASKGEIRDLAKAIEAMALNLESSYESLESKVSERTARLEQANCQLQAMNEALAEANTYKSHFLTIVSHELKTPMTSIIAFVDILRKTVSNENERRMLDEIQSSSNSLLEMINNIIDAAKLEAGRFELHTNDVDMVDVANAVEAMVAPIAQRKGIALSTDVSNDVPVIRSDRDALYKILLNLVSNAVKFTNQGGSVHIAVDMTTDNQGSDSIDMPARIPNDASAATSAHERYLLITVSDTGIGIDACDLEIIFERFVQPNPSLSRQHGGSGLGLSIVHDFVDALEGTIRVESEVGNGSSFSVFLPVQEAKFYEWDETEGRYENPDSR